LPDYESAGAVWAPLSAITGDPGDADGHGSSSSSSSSSGRGGRWGSGSGQRSDGRSPCGGPPVYPAATAGARGRRVRLRGDEPLKYCPYVASGGVVLPLAIPPEHADAFRDVPF
jgi:hypothetical protein